MPTGRWPVPEADLGTPVPFRGGGFAPQRRRFAGLAVLLVVLGLWQAGSSAGLISPILVPSPAEVLRALWQLIVTGEIFGHLTASLYRLGIGGALGVSAGIAVGLAAGIFSLARSTGLPVVAALYPIPKIALLPLFILWFGIGEPAKIATIAFGTFFPMVIATAGGVDAVDRTLIRMAQSFGLSTGQIVRHVILPATLPAILPGLRIAASTGIVLLVAAEMIGAEKGLGAFVLLAGNLMATDRLLAGVVVLSLLGLCLSAAIGWLERRLLGWR